MIRQIFTFFILTSIAISCDSINPDEPIPAWLKIDTAIVNTNYQAQGSASSNISDVFIFIDGTLQGAHDLPLNTPILESGKHTLFIAAVIKRNGLGGLRIDYPFYTQFEVDVDLLPGDTTTITPVFEYVSPLTIFTEDFEDPGIKLISDFGSDTSIVITKNPEEVFERTGSGIIRSDTSGTFFFIRTDEAFNFNQGQPIFAELDYNTDEDFEFGIIANFPSGRVSSRIGFVRNTIEENQGSVWKKIYFDLSSAINRNSAAGTFDFYISGQSSGVGQDFIFDNLKIINR